MKQLKYFQTSQMFVTLINAAVSIDCELLWWFSELWKEFALFLCPSWYTNIYY